MKKQASVFEQSSLARRPPYFLLGTLIFLLGMIIYIIQIETTHLVEAWHVPILGTIGVLLMLVSVVQRPRIVRIIGLLLFIGLTGTEWYMVLAGSKVRHAPEARPWSPYAGPAKPGEKLPAFTATLADGSSFSNLNLQEGKPTLMVFFLGKS